MTCNIYVEKCINTSLEGVSMSNQIDKKKEIEELVKKQRDLSKSSQELLLSVEKIRDEIENSRESVLYEENQFQKEKLLKLEKDFSLIQSLNKELKEKVAMLTDELKSVKSQKRNETINIFESTVMNNVGEDFEKSLIQKLDKYQKYINKKIEKIKNELPQEQKERNSEILKKLKEVEEEAKELIEKEKEKIRNESEKFDSEIKLFTSDIESEYNQKEDKYLYEKEKKNFGIEKLVGMKGFFIVGITFIFIAIAIFFREEFMRLFNNKYGKSMWTYLTGFGFLASGEYFYKKRKKEFAVGMLGGGVGILYLATIMSSTYLHLYPLKLGLLLAVILTALAVILSLKYNSQIIGIIALIGGYIPYLTSLRLQSRENIVYLAAYSIILQFVVLAVSWKKNWKHMRITGFIVGMLNTIFLMTYMYELKINIYIIYALLLAFTTMYSYVFLKGAEHENRSEKPTDYVFLGINLFVKFVSVLTLAHYGKVSTIEKAGIFLLVGFIYTILAERLKIYNLSKTFTLMGLASFIVVVPVLVPKAYLPLAWGLEVILIYYLGKKQDNKQLIYGSVILYVITILANIPIVSEQKLNFDLTSYFILQKNNEGIRVPVLIYFANQIMIISLSFGVYNYIFNNKKSKIKSIGLIIKYIALTKGTLLFIDIIHYIERKIKRIFLKNETSIYEYKEVFKVLAIIFVVVFLLRFITDKFKKYQDKFSIWYLVIVEIIGTLSVYATIPIMYPHKKVILFEPALVVLLLTYLFLVLRTDLYRAIYNNRPKNIQWIFGESTYLIFMSRFLLYKYNIPRSQLIINIIGLMVCINLVLKGFKAPNKNLRRLGLAIGVIFTTKGAFDFMRTALESNYKVIGYGLIGISLIFVSYIYQNALKKLESGSPDDDPDDSNIEFSMRSVEETKNEEIHNKEEKSLKVENENTDSEKKELEDKESIHEIIMGNEKEEYKELKNKNIENKDDFVYIGNKKYKKVKKKKEENNKEENNKEVEHKKETIFKDEEKEKLTRESEVINKSELIKEQLSEEDLIKIENERIMQELEEKSKE